MKKMKYVIYNMENVDTIDFTQVLEDSVDTLRLSVNGTKTVLKFEGETNSLVIGKNNIIREYVTSNPGTKGGGRLTSIGNNCLFTAFVKLVSLAFGSVSFFSKI